ncbi:MAG: hypothetical protein K0Q95_3368 [Bacteroidota bacterium]|jgi:TonB family protein|nr:hypothetical protein [Bacteroidota bacterium]
MKNLILLSILLIVKPAFAQFDTTFYNQDWIKCTSKSEAVFYRVVEKQGDLFLIKDMYLKTNTPQMIALCGNATEPLVKEGKCTYFSAEGIKVEEGTYKANRKTGIWVTWYDGGKDSSVINYRENAEPEYLRISNKQSVSPDGQVYTIVESMPSFPGGEKAMADFLRKNIFYPMKEMNKGITGTCYVTFIVDTDGSIINPRIRRGVPNGEGCDKEALRVVRMMPKWKPGTQNGKLVKVEFNLPIKFSLNGK